MAFREFRLRIAPCIWCRKQWDLCWPLIPLGWSFGVLTDGEAQEKTPGCCKPPCTISWWFLSELVTKGLSNMTKRSCTGTGSDWVCEWVSNLRSFHSLSLTWVILCLRPSPAVMAAMAAGKEKGNELPFQRIWSQVLDRCSVRCSSKTKICLNDRNYQTYNWCSTLSDNSSCETSWVPRTCWSFPKAGELQARAGVWEGITSGWDVTHGTHPKVATPVLSWPRKPELGDTSDFLPDKTKTYKAVYWL